MIFRVTAKAVTWARDSFELLDYDATDVVKSVIKTKSSCYLIRTQIGPEFIENPLENNPLSYKFLAKLQSNEGKPYTDYYIISPVTNFQNKDLTRAQYEKLWLVVRSLKLKTGSSGYLLAEGDVFRIGRCKFRLKELNSNRTEAGKEFFSLCDILSNQADDSIEDSKTARTFVLPCRICLSETYEPENPLISPCKCGGTMKFIHLKCLQQCLMSKLTSKSSDSVLSFHWKKLCCDLCKKTYPYKLILPNKTIELLEIPKPPGLYLILEVLCKDKTSLKGLHVVHLGGKNSIVLGRAQSCELRVTDISVSRNHAKISFISGNFYLEDTGSKFGTLVQVKRPIVLEENKDITVQSGRSLITYSLKKPWSLIPACFRRSSSIYDCNPNSLNVPILPINTGIPVSVSDPDKLLLFAGIPTKNKEKYNQNKNLLYEHNQLGANSSYEIEDCESIESAEEVEIASNEKSEALHCEDTNRYEEVL